jgi:hypothetical protein
MEVVMGLVVGAGALLLAKRGRKAMTSAIGWTARKGGWVAGRVRSSLSDTAQIAREQYQRGRMDAARAHASIPPSTNGTSTNGVGHAADARTAEVEQPSATTAS